MVKHKVIIALSGGVDSAVAAFLLKQKGYDVNAVFMRNWVEPHNSKQNKNICPQEQDWLDAKKVAEQLKIPITRVSFAKEYWNKVFKDMLKKYKKGLTPNPDILCNKYIKFDLFLKYVKKQFPDFDFIATGHYAKLENGYLKVPHDLHKDQTYFLAQVKKNNLVKFKFPLENLSKNQVRTIAEKEKLIVAKKKDSTGICFIGERKFISFLQEYLKPKQGKIILKKTNQVIGTHPGAMYFTLGQRKGLHLSGQKARHFVVEINAKQNLIYVTEAKDIPASDKALITSVNWLYKNKKVTNVKVKFRYRSAAINCNLKWIGPKTLILKYEKNKDFISPGQQAVFYSKKICLGGGFIKKVFTN